MKKQTLSEESLTKEDYVGGFKVANLFIELITLFTIMMILLIWRLNVTSIVFSEILPVIFMLLLASLIFALITFIAMKIEISQLK